MIDKVKVVNRLLKNRRRFKNNYKRVHPTTIAYKLDRSCLCGLEVGDRFIGKTVVIQVRSAGQEVYLTITKVQ